MFTTTGKLLYSVEHSPSKSKDSTGVYRNPKYKDKLIDNFEDVPLSSVWDGFNKSAEKYKNKNCFGTRVRKDDKLGEYKWKSFEEVRELIILVGSGLMNKNVCPVIDCEDATVPKGRFLGLYLPNCEEWNICDFSCNAFNIITVPLYDSLGIESSKFILDQTMMQTITCNKACALKLLKSLGTFDQMFIKTLILVEKEIDPEIKKLSNKLNIKIVTWDDLIESGRKKRLEPRPGKLSDVCSICYTSGTTGYPKGVIMTNQNFVAQIASSCYGPIRLPNLIIDEKDTHLSYLPLAHIYERIMLSIFIYLGVRIGYYSGNILALTDDIQELKPTLFLSVPRLYNRIHERICNSLKKKPSVLQSLFNKGVDQKIKKLNNTGNPCSFFWDTLLFNKAKKILGGNVRGMLNGSAPLGVEVAKRLKCIFSVPLMEGFGMTEGLGCLFITNTYDKDVGHIGGPLPATEFRLVSVPEMNYLVTDNPPRGELLLRGPTICKLGYFKLEKETSELIDEDGWMRTGDIACFSSNQSITIIDRKKNIFKLSQGEYVAVEKIESVYKQSLFIGQIFVFGYSYESFLVCIVFPSFDTMEIWAKENKINNKKNEEIIKLEKFKTDVIQDLIKIGKNNGLNGYEQIKDIHFIMDGFTIENDLMTPTGKIKRHAVQTKYKQEIDKMYERVKKA
ncbi:acyl-CoA synthetase, putative [Plasmodium vinckei brucechwatti]|uniref:Acyl-CoA synthetase, putative n=1 Tax=Plasmodium vinckei brucechwatti TaxID=119398 RepID=A0A6V7SJF1_PLAVN|nr:acyl-CoA synthetase, putative [Plasmodium vinckei brucechwatti]